MLNYIPNVSTERKRLHAVERFSRIAHFASQSDTGVSLYMILRQALKSRLHTSATSTLGLTALFGINAGQ
jgi:hypothetical protein